MCGAVIAAAAGLQETRNFKIRLQSCPRPVERLWCQQRQEGRRGMVSDCQQVQSKQRQPGDDVTTRRDKNVSGFFSQL